MNSITKIVIGALMVCSAIWAQGSTAQINGTVRDSSGSAVVGAEVTVTQTATGFVRKLTTGADGGYVFSSLPIGPYQLDVASQGFKNYTQTGIVLQVQANPTIDVALALGAITESVRVEADAALVETRSTSVGQVIDHTRVLELPLNGRNVQELLILSGTAVGGGTQGTNRNYPTDSISVGGGLTNGLTYRLDGGTHNDPFNNLNLPLPFPDALQEFKVETSAIPAQYGQHSAGIVNAITKAGTNSLHGDLFYFVRNGAMNARNTFALTNDGLKRNQFGGVLGGAILKNKLFFFVGEQTTLVRSTPTSQIAYIPTANMLNGDWSAFASAACNGGTPLTLRAPFVNNQISPTAFSRVATNLVKRFPTTNDPCGKLTYGQQSRSDEHTVVTRIDFQISQKQSLFGRYQIPMLDVPTTYDGSNVLSLSQPGQVLRAHSIVLGHTYVFDATTVNTFRATALRTKAVKTAPDLFNLSDLGAANMYYPPELTKLTLINVSGAFNLGNTSVTVPGFTNSTDWQLANDLSTVRGAHQLSFGVDYIHTNLNANAGSSAPGLITINATNTGSSLGDFMTGKMNNFAQAPVQNQYMRQHYLGLYAQDTWKVNSRLTANLGLRWEPYFAPSDLTGHALHFTQGWFDQGIRSTVYKNAPVGVLYPGDPGIPGPYKLTNNRKNNFGPRLGLAFDPKGDGRMTIRASYAILYDYPALYQYPGVRDDAPWGSRVSLTNANLDDPWATYPGGNPFPLTLGPDTKFLTTVGYTSLPVNFKNTYIQQWNVSLQKQFGTNWLTSASYLGNQGTHVLFLNEGNPAVYLPGASCVLNGVTYTPCSSVANTNQRRMLSLQNPRQGVYYSNIANVDDGLTRNYNAMVLSLQRRQAKGFTVQANYTWSHCIDGGTTPLSSATGSNPMNRRAENRGNCELDRRHNFNLSSVYQTPSFKNGLVRAVASRWQISGIVRLVTGSFMTVGTGVDRALTGTPSTGPTANVSIAADQRPDQILANPYSTNQTLNSWLNPAAFAQPALGTYGNMGGRNIQGPGQITINAGITRQFPVMEGKWIEFRFEAFNLPNHVNPNNPNTTFSDTTTFGKILSAGDPRILQLAMKFVF